MNNQNNSPGSYIDLWNQPLHGNNDFTHRMSSADIDGLLTVAADAADKQYDANKVIDALHCENIIPNRICDYLKSMYAEGEDFWIVLKLSRYCSFSSLKYGLYVCNYVDIAERLEHSRYGTAGPATLTVSKAEGNHDSALELYYNLKKHIDNSAFKDRTAFLRLKADHFMNEIQILNPESTRRKQCLFDKMVVIRCLTVEVTTDSEIRTQALNDMRNDKILRQAKASETPIYGKEASTYALQGDFDTAEELMLKARLILVNTKASWVIYYHYLNEVFLKVAEFEKTPCNEVKQGLLFYGFAGVHSLANEDEEIQRMWKRIFISFMLYGLLCFGLFLEEIDFPITNEDRKLARTILLEFDRLSQDMETRRDMLYALFMARLHEDSNVEQALIYAKRAQTMSKNGELRKGEAENISKFISKLHL